ncbi:4'-phosphopantetheinyl transferase family protein [Dyella caseinilytica]|uniref:4'-phosphopantetheinyl transferase superfamily protein n=1 Tax=Dyella caseinilytica TaxID=1849581 RepID=A0ABX7GTH5_9GAMM|nr:4'-phosphopantetheinyl transferase superfamily protein [Dyella caseinilytica]QRN53764.1 4'-phosphopantetheinyl transferase superfamily protein [Dyella caseinilytica]GFZ88964.1 4'-phosphopantetheinyl transferase [Dyella caseinilytica]
MRTTLGQDVAGIASGLDNRAIHVWLLDYQRSLRREPLCALLGVYLGVPAADVVLREGEYGRPELIQPWRDALQFNWSHSGDKAIIAVARDVIPGIDIERTRPRPKVMELAERFFHPAEAAALNVLDHDQREEDFLRLWTSKEAVLKALGRGLAFGLDRLHVALKHEGAALRWLDGEDASSWQLHALAVGGDYRASLAWRGPPRAIDIWTLADDS